MDFKQLEAFVAVVKFKNFSKAGQHLYLSQPTISSHISNLEKQLNTILINRSNKKITATKAGDLLYDYAISMINLKHKAIFKLGEFEGQISGNIELASSTIPEQYIIPDLICEFNKMYPHVTFTMRHYDSKQVVDGIINGEIDFGIIGRNIPHKQLQYVELNHDELLFVTPYTEPYNHSHAELTLQDILKEKFIFREKGSGTRALFEESLNTTGFAVSDLKIVAFIENTEAIKQCIRRGLGVSFLSSKAVEDEIKYNLLSAHRIKDLNLQRNFYFVYHKHRSPSPLEAEFQSFVCQYFKNGETSNE
ncbi:transcriptional regulator, LysR family [Alkaliphilus metalliredigens QYMF]|uniref:Transcriptional regulator, LysR family n=1 Tax=Alkaliphilus metalliredigens (strain QYMF) TaxID=293826 RepID=A6TLX8_ALKMQ|nr:selenium metabolism-associated LysR family transcriptional regulator [Alkaliphilus metalliredigens]ABR47196.1 transcriptional regulator, LysR family [Alkaliphilus metalliredigens QYMF]